MGLARGPEVLENRRRGQRPFTAAYGKPIDMLRVKGSGLQGAAWSQWRNLGRRRRRANRDPRRSTVALSLRTTNVVLFDECPEEALVEAIRRNVAHGLPPTVKEHEHAALPILAAPGECSRRMFARICGLSGFILVRQPGGIGLASVQRRYHRAHKADGLRWQAASHEACRSAT